jgi:hypothetical protein
MSLFNKRGVIILIQITKHDSVSAKSKSVIQYGQRENDFLSNRAKVMYFGLKSPSNQRIQNWVLSPKNGITF